MHSVEETGAKMLVVTSRGGSGGALVMTVEAGVEKWGQMQETFRRQNLQGLLVTDD